MSVSDMYGRLEGVDLGPHGDALLYREYTLGLIWPRSCPEFLDDDVVSYWLNKCAAENPLPWL